MKKTIFTLMLHLAAIVSTNAQLKLGNNPTSINANSVLEMETTNKGMLLPRVPLSATTNVAPLSAHVAGMAVYNTATAGDVTPGYYFNDGTKWVRIAAVTGSGNYWDLRGNAGTVTATNFIGTTDNVPFNIRVNNLKAGTITSTGPVFLGYQAGNVNTAATSTAIGYQSLYSNTIGTFNTANGNQTLYSNTTANNNTANGNQALYSNITGTNNTGYGYHALVFNTLGINNTAKGGQLLYYNTTGNDNTADGYRAIHTNTTGFNNTANGVLAFFLNTTGNNNTANGYQSLYYNATGSNNTALGQSAGLGAVSVNFTQCTFVGANSYPTTARTNVTMLGYGIANAQCTGNNQVLLGNTSITQIRAQVTGITAYSDARFKTNIKDNVAGLDFILKLKPVTYNVRPEELHKIWGTPDSLIRKIDHGEAEKETRIGFLAQDVEKAANESGFQFPGIDVPKNDKEVYTLRYVDFIMPMVKAMQEQQTMIEQQNTQNMTQQKTLNSLQSTMNKLETENRLWNLKMDEIIKSGKTIAQ